MPFQDTVEFARKELPQLLEIASAHGRHLLQMRRVAAIKHSDSASSETRGPGPRMRLPVLAMLTGLAACAAEMQSYPPPSAEMREQLGSSPLVPVRYEQMVAPDDPNSGAGAGALAGAGNGALLGGGIGAFPGTLLCSAPVTCLFGLPLAIVGGGIGAIAGGVVGAGVGAGMALDPEEVEAASANLRAALEDVTMTEDLLGHLRAAGSRHRVDALLLADGTATEQSGGQEMSDRTPSGSILEIGVSQVEFEYRGAFDPELSIRIWAGARLVRASDRADLYHRVWEYRSLWRNYFDLAEDDAALRAMIDSGLRRLADAIVIDLFVTNRPDIHAASPVPEGRTWTTMAWSASPDVPANNPSPVARQEPEALGSSAVAPSVP